MYWIDNNTGIATAPDVPAVISATKRFFTNGGSGVPPSVPEDFWFHMIQEELLGVLTMAGIAPAKGDLNQIAKAIQSIAFSAYPVGSPIPWPTAVPPSGFLAMTGQSFSATTYPRLAQAYPSLVLPDMRAEFIRGWDNGRGIDPGRTLLSSQLSSFSSHSHNGDLFRVDNSRTNEIPYSSVSARDAITSSGGGALSFDDFPVATIGPGSYYIGNQLTSAAGGTETRPRSISFNYIVRAA